LKEERKEDGRRPPIQKRERERERVSDKRFEKMRSE